MINRGNCGKSIKIYDEEKKYSEDVCMITKSICRGECLCEKAIISQMENDIDTLSLGITMSRDKIKRAKEQLKVKKSIIKEYKLFKKEK